MKSYKASGVVLHTLKYGDNSLIAYIFTDLYGRRNYLIRGVGGARKKGNKAALLQPTSIIEYEGYEGRHSDLHGIREARNKVILSGIAFDMRKSTIALFMAEVLYRLVREETPNKPLFDFICSSIESLDRADSANTTAIANFHLWFLVRLSEYLGFYPGGEYHVGDMFDIEEGLFCSAYPQHGNYMGAAGAATLDAMMRSDADELGEVKLKGEQRSEFMNDILNFFNFHFDIINNINSLSILRDVFR